MRLVVVTNIPTPYRIPVYELLADEPDIDLAVVYLAARESNRSWTLPPTEVRSFTLTSRSIRVAGRYVHLTSGTWRLLSRLRPEVVVTTGFNPPHLIAFLYARLHRVPHVVQTDGTVESEESLTAVHRFVRRLVGRRSAALVAASRSGAALVRAWGRPHAPVLISPLAVDNTSFARAAAQTVKDVDLLFTGQLADVKDPLFALEVADRTAERLGRKVTIAVVGDGPLQDAVARRSERLHGRVQVLMPGFQQQDLLPHWYARSRVFLFPTRWDPWGLVLNEALAAGVPAVVSPDAGSGAELLAEGRGGRIVAKNVDEWTDHVVDLLQDERLLEHAGAEAQDAVAAYTWRSAADGLADAARRAVAGRR